MRKLSPVVRALVIAMTLGFLFYNQARPLVAWMTAHLLVSPNLLHGELWQPFTSLFLNTRLSGLIFTVIGLWWVGEFIESSKGPRFFLKLFLGAGAAANLAAGLVSFALPGAVGAVRGDGAAFALTAIFVVFARLYGARPAQIWGALAMRADYFTWIVIGFSLVMSLVNGDWGGLAGELVAIAIGFALTGGLAEVRSRWGGPKGRARVKYRVLDGGKRTPTYFN